MTAKKSETTEADGGADTAPLSTDDLTKMLTDVGDAVKAEDVTEAVGPAKKKAPTKVAKAEVNTEVGERLSQGVMVANPDIKGSLAPELEGVASLMFIYAPKCLRCLHLIPEHGSPKAEAFEDCHHSAGNDSCPAKFVRIITGMPVDATAERIWNAMSSGDTSEVSEVTAKLDGRHPLVRQMVMDRVKHLAKTA